MNLYAYCGNDPVNGIDRLGLWDMSHVIQIVGNSEEGAAYLRIAAQKGYTIEKYGSLGEGVNGWTSLSVPLIMLANTEAGKELSDGDAATMLIHELRHVWQLTARPVEYPRQLLSLEWHIRIFMGSKPKSAPVLAPHDAPGPQEKVAPAAHLPVDRW